MENISISALPPLTAIQMDGTERFFIQRGNDNFRVSADEFATYALSKTVQPSSEKTLNGGANNGLINNYVDLFTPRVGNKVHKVFIDAAGLVPSGDTATISVVLTDGNPLNDVELVEPKTTASINDQLSSYPIDKTVVAAGFSVKLLVEGATITAGTIQVTLYYIPS
jgi:hypothetical protein